MLATQLVQFLGHLLGIVVIFLGHHMMSQEGWEHVKQKFTDKLIDENILRYRLENIPRQIMLFLFSPFFLLDRNYMN